MGTRKWVALAMALLLVFLLPAGAAAGGYEWRDHAAPFDFEFGNPFDDHQQSRLTGKTGLTGFLYIAPTGDDVDGVPIVEHGTDSVGWGLKGIAMEATYCGHPEGEHEAWIVDPEDIPRQRGFTHFHWEGPHDDLAIGETFAGYLLKLTAVDTFWFDHHGLFPVTPGIDFETHANLYTECPDLGGDGGHEG